MSIGDQQLAQIEQQLRVDHVYVDPSMRTTIRPEVLAEVRQLVKGSPQTINVVITPLSYDDPNFHGRTELLTGTLHSDLGGDAAYITVLRVYDSTPQISVNGYGIDGASDAAYVARELYPDDASAALLKATQLLHDGNAQKAYEQLQQARESPSASPTTGTTTDSGSGSSEPQHVSAVSLSVLVVLLALVAVWGTWLRRLRSRRPAENSRDAVTTRPFTLPVTVLGHIRAAQEAETVKRAEREVLALGERIDGTDLLPRANTASWQAALDHYDLARRILDRSNGPADVVGAVVLAERGQDALTAATAGSAYLPVPPCFFNPLHGPGKPTEWEGVAGRTTVPMCADCARAVSHGSRPAVLDFLVNGKAQHYYDLDLEPWSSTGYGSLVPDLTGALFDRRPSRGTRRRRGRGRSR